jgi:hypothetical protein
MAELPPSQMIIDKMPLTKVYWESVLTLLCLLLNTTMLKSYALKRNSTVLLADKHSPICWQSHSFVPLLAKCVSPNRQMPKALVHTQGFWHLYQDKLKHFGKAWFHPHCLTLFCQLGKIGRICLVSAQVQPIWLPIWAQNSPNTGKNQNCLTFLFKSEAL